MLALSTLLSAAAAAQENKLPELKTVPKVDLSRYSGKWYEIARYPNRFQKQCVGSTSATYSLKPNGRIEVLNQCVKEGNVIDAAKGEAKVVDKATNAKLKVRFAPKALSWLPMVWGDYWVIDLDPAYRYAVIGEPSHKYFWILSREPKMDDRLYDQILRRAETMGFDPSRVICTSQR